MLTSHSREKFRFGDFELDVGAYELRRLGRPVRLGRQPMDLLILLVEHRGHLVPRSTIVDRLWGSDVFVDVETGVNTNVSKIRNALRDSPDAPRFVETVPGKGYRFAAPVEVVSSAPVAGAAPSATEAVSPMGSTAPQPAGALGRAVTTLPDSAASSGAPGAFAGPALPGLDEARSRNRSLAPPRVVVGMVVLAAVAGILVWTARDRTVPARVTLAVLPFQNFGDDPDRQYLADGFTDETSASLAQIDPERLSVRGRTLRYRGTTKTAVEIGRELSVDYLVESSLRAEGPRVRITVTLIRVRDQEHVWSQSYEREPTSVLGLQQEISAAIAEQVRLRLSPERATGLARRQTRSAAAYDEYLRGRFLASRRAPATNERAVDHFQRAVALDPDYALAWSELAFTYIAGVVNSDARPTVMWPLARKAAAEALRANANLAEAHATAGFMCGSWDGTGGRRKASTARPSASIRARPELTCSSGTPCRRSAGRTRRSSGCGARASSSPSMLSITPCRRRCRSRVAIMTPRPGTRGRPSASIRTSGSAT
ncbi:MAG: winged helix-turn-helix domain-containing protein [Acidobacteriota bacterium]|nr:winged helix-turn-helix domain-containing protein [Acidobacteriota bacterium]